MTSPNKLVWDDRLKTGHPEIDDQHMILVHTLNEASERLAKESNAEILGQITQDLLSYALYHFETEEDLMQSQGYVHASAEEARKHLEEHRAFSSKVVNIRENLKAGILIRPDALIEFLNTWLVQHILHTDRKLVAFLNERPKG